MFHISSNLPIISLNMYHISNQANDRRDIAGFLCILNGSLKLNMDDDHYFLQSEDIIFIPSDTVYTIAPETPSLLMYINFHPYFLLETLGFHHSDIRYCSCNSSNEIQGNLIQQLASLAVALIANNNCQIMSKAYDLLYEFSLLITTKEEIGVKSKTDQKLAKYKSFLEKNYNSQISLSDVANAMNYTPQYLSNFIKKNINSTFQESLNKLRLQAALLMIRFSEESSGRISTFCGFPNTPSFLKIFDSECKMSPDEYRESFKQKSQFPQSDAFTPIKHETLILDYIFNYMHYVVKGSVLHEKNLVQEEHVNLSKYTELKPYWITMINLGTVTDFEKPAFRFSLTNMQEYLHFRYGRCIGILLLVQEQSIDGQLTFDFSRIFEVTDFLLSIHMKPMFELSNKPFHIYKANETELTDYNLFLEPEKYDSFFFRVLPYFIKACITRYGFDEFSSWKLELWRRYNPSMTSLESPPDYFTRFQKTAEIIKNLVPNVELGGPGFNTFLATKYFDELLLPFVGACYQPDFVSAYYFPYLPQEPVNDQLPSGFTTVPTASTMLQKIHELNDCKAKNAMASIPLYMTEYSAFISSANYINDSSYPAVFILQQTIEGYEKADVLSYWLASDISLSYSNYSSPLFGGNGIISRDSIPKSSFYAFAFLNQLGSYFVTKGEHFIVTRSEDNSIQVLVFYQANLNHKFAASPFNQELLHYPYSAFEDLLPLKICIELTHLSNGKYLLREQTINLSHGNLLSSWGRLNYWKKLRLEEIEYLRHESIPSVNITTVNIENSYYLQTRLGYNEAKLFTLELNL